jgi:hypothetical protein
VVKISILNFAFELFASFMPVWFMQLAYNQQTVTEIGGEKPVKNREKSSQPAKNQILATAIESPYATRSPRETSIMFPHIFHFMIPLFCTSFARNSNAPPRPRYSRVAPTAVCRGSFWAAG